MTEKNVNPVWLTGSKEIGQAIGFAPRKVPKLVAEQDLPAFKFCGRWTATLEDVAAWSKDVAARHRIRQRRKK